MPSATEILLLIKARDEASKEFDKLTKSTGGLGKTLGQVGTIASGFLAAGAVQAGVAKVTSFINDSIGAARESIQVNAQLNAVLESTGGAAGVTAEQIQKWAGALEKQTLFEDEAIIKGQNLLLTFTNIRNDTAAGIETFNDATTAMLDIAQAMGTDASGAAIQLGKALNDPANGISSLTRIGVTFSEQQKEQIKGFQESGNMAAAQAVILQELQKEFGGSAKAASDAAGQQEKYKDRMNELQEQIGTKMIPIQEKMTEAKLALVNALVTYVIPAIGDFIKIIGQIIDAIRPVFPVIEEFANFWIERVRGAIQAIEGIVEVVRGVINLVSALVHGDWSAAWQALKDIAMGIVNTFLGELKFLFGSIPSYLLGLVTSMYDAGANFINGLWNGIKDAASGLLEKVKGIGNEIVKAVKDPLGIFSPSRVMYEIGQETVEGYTNGVVDEGVYMLEQVGGVWQKASDVIAGTNHTIVDGAQKMADDVITSWKRMTIEMNGSMQELVVVTTDTESAIEKETRLMTEALQAYSGDTGVLLEEINGEWRRSTSTVVGESFKVVSRMEAVTLMMEQAKERMKNAVTQMQLNVPTLNTPTIMNVRSMQSGGLVTRNTLAYLHAGERVIPANRAGAAVNIYVQGSVLSERDLLRVVSDWIQTGGARGAII